MLRIRRYKKPVPPYKSYNSRNNNGYFCIRISTQKKVGLHVAIWAFHNKRWPKEEIDHIDRDRTNNKIGNLREATRLENAQNNGMPKVNTSGVQHVSWSKAQKKWRVDFKVNGKQFHLGFFKTKEEAEAVANENRPKYHPFRS